MNELYQRVKFITKKFAGSESKMALLLGIQQRTFNGYLNKQRQGRLLELLPAILEEFPQINRDWLFFGEGEMLQHTGVGIKTVATSMRTVAHPPGAEGAQAPPTPHIDAALLQQVIEMLEEHLHAVKGTLTPANKAVVISQLYELVIEGEVENRQPIQMMRLVMGALAKAAND